MQRTNDSTDRNGTAAFGAGRRRLVSGLLMAGALVLLPSGCSETPTVASDASPPAKETIAAQRPPSGPPLVRLEPAAVRRAGLTVGAAREVRATRLLRVEGRVAANENRTVTAGSFTQGIVVEGYSLEGSVVKEGEVLARIHSHELHEVETEYRQAQAELGRRKAELQYAQQAYARASRLHEIKAGSLQQVQQAQTALESAEAAVSIAEAAIESATIHLRYLGVKPQDIHEGWDSLSKAHEDEDGLQHLVEVRSPITGTVISRKVSKGDVVALAEPLYTISDLRRLWVIAQVPEEHLASLREGVPVEVLVRAYPSERFRGRIVWIADSLDPNTRTVQVRCEVANPGGRLKLEMYATLLIRAGNGDLAIVVPAEAVQDVDGLTALFVQSAESAFELREVKTGRQLAEGIEIVEGLNSGELVVVGGAFTLKSELLKDRMIEEE